MANALVEEEIKKNSVMVFSKSYCPFCKMAKDALKAAGLREASYSVIFCTKHVQNIDISAFLKYLVKLRH